GEVLRALDEGQRDPVRTHGKGGVEILAVLLGNRPDRQLGVGNADALPVGDLRAGNDNAVQRVHVLRFAAQLQPAVVDQQPVTRFHGLEDFGVREVDPFCVAWLWIVVEGELLPRLQFFRAVCEFADPKLRPLQVNDHADRPSGLRLDLADAGDERAHQIVVCVAHVDAEQVRTCLEQLADRYFIGGSRSQRGEDLDRAAASHCESVPGNPLLVTAGPSPCAGRSVSWIIQLDWAPVSYSWKPARWKPRAKQSLTPAILNSRSATHMLIGPSQRPPRSASSA